MTLDSVFRQWAQSITTDSVDTSVRTIPSDRDGAKMPLARGYVQCVLAGTSNVDAEYPFKVKFVSADGSDYTVDMSTDDRSTTSVTESSAPGGIVPANSTLLKYIMSSDWEVGSAASFASTQSGGNLYW